MLFSQIIAFILVMVVWEAYRPGPPTLGPAQSLSASLMLMAWLWVGARLRVVLLLRRITGPHPPPDPARAARRALTGLNAAAVACLAVMVVFLDIKVYLLALPLVAASETLSGLCAVGLFFALLSIVWAAGHPLESEILGQPLNRRAFIASQARFVAPVIFPWLAVAVIRDLLTLAWPSARSWLDTGLGDLFFLAAFVVLMALFFPPMVRLWWGCRPWPEGMVRQVSREVLAHTKVTVAGILSWPIMRGRLITAGILGVAPAFRYLLITPALAENLTPMELAGVVAHEAGHVRHRHLVLYIMFFMGFFLAAYALTGPIGLTLDWIILHLAATEWGREFLGSQGRGSAMMGVLMALPLVALLILYLRFLMGWFMRHFERQADFFALQTMGDAAPLAGALEKVARVSGGTRDVPSWHHFSVAQRVDALEKAHSQPGVIARHAAGLKRGLIWYLVGLGLLCVLGFGLGQVEPAREPRLELAAQALEEALASRPHDAALHRDLGSVLFELGRERRAVQHLAAAVALNPRDPEALNALAWLLATSKDPDLRSPTQAVELARRAVEMSPIPEIWDTLAEAYFVDGQVDKAVAAARAALAAGPESREDYFIDQLKRFRAAQEKETP